MDNNNNIYNLQDIKINKDKIDETITNGLHTFKKFAKLIGIPIILLILFNMFTFTVRQDQVAAVVELGKITKIIVDNIELTQGQNDSKASYKNVKIIGRKGLFFKVPFITEVRKETSKLLTYMATPELVNTKDKRQYLVAFFSQYEITHPGLFYETMGSIRKAQDTLDELVYPIIIRRINQLESEAFLNDKELLNAALDEGLSQLNQQVASYGITVRDNEIYRTLLPQTNIQSTYNKMRAEREAIAQQIRSEGKENYDKTVAETNKQEKETLAQAIETSEQIKGEADAKALEIYANAFSQDEEFYEYWRTLKAYEKTIDSNTVIYMDRNNEFLKYFSN